MLELKDVGYHISENNEKKIILDNVNLKFDNNLIYIITGVNGSGKSTLVKIIMGIIKPSSGQILYNGTDITNYSITQRAKLGFCFAFQQPITFKGLKIRNLLEVANPNITNVGFGCDYLSKVGMCAKKYIDRPFDNKLSGGEQKRIELALALSRDAKVNIFDEPEAGIDLWSFESLIKVFKNLTETTIIVSHQKKIINIADEIIVLEKGRVKKITSDAKSITADAEQTCGRLAENE